MATTTATITLSSSTLLTDSLNMSVAMSVTGSDTTGIARTKTSVTKDSAAALLYGGGFATEAYMYIKNVDATDSISVFTDTAADDADVIKLGPGQWAFLPVAIATVYRAYSSANTPYVEWLVYGTE